MRLLYQLGLHGYSLLLHVAALAGHRKAQRWIEGRKKWEERIKTKFKATPPCIWIHCASLGEYELSVPLIKELKKRNPSEIIFISFFSPSGYEVKKNDSLVFHLDYLPVDSPDHAKKLIELIRPKMVFFAKYDFWYYYLHELKKQSIPTYLFSASFRTTQAFFKPYGSWYRKMLLQFNTLFVIDEESKKLLTSIGITSVIVVGDTRYDRVSDTASSKRNIPYIEEFKTTHQLLIAGSTWPEDEALLISLINEKPQDLKFIIAPHEIQTEHIEHIEEKLTVPFIRYSQLTETRASLNSVTVLIIDNIGMLSSLYQCGDIAYVGGAFKQGLHNILEPLSFGLPVVFGPHYKRYPEAISFIEHRGAFSIKDYESLADTINKLRVRQYLDEVKKSNRVLIAKHIGATEKILNTIQWQN